MAMLILSYFLLAAIVIFAAVKVSNQVDLLDKKTSLGGALIGGFLLAATTSLPEVITSLTSVVDPSIADPTLAVGNILGSNIFNVLIIALVDIYFIKRFFLNKVSYINNKALISVIFVYLTVGIGMFFGTKLTVDFIGLKFSLIVILILLQYLYTIKLLSNAEEALEPTAEIKIEPASKHFEDKIERTSLTSIIVGFLLWAAVLVVMSIFITKVTDRLADELNLGASFAGSLFLGIATSLPEATAVFYLVKIKNYDLAIANIIGSNIFNLAILAFVDVFYIEENIFASIWESSNILWIIGLVNCVLLLYTLLRRKTSNAFTYILPSVVIVIGYITYLFYSTL